MGSILSLAVQGTQPRAQAVDDGMTVLQIPVVLGGSGIQMSVAATPHPGGVWEEPREEIRRGLEDQGAKVADYPTRRGNELLVDIPMQMPGGRPVISHMRVISCGGDRWFARIDILGPAVVIAEAGVDTEKVIDRIVTCCDDYPRTHLELLLMRPLMGVQGA